MAQYIKLPNNALGANIGEMQTLSAHLKTTIEQLDGIFKTVDSKIGTTTWAGPDATKSENEWNTHRQQTMTMLRNWLDATSQAISKQAAQQTSTSNS
jgi:N-methylhydantoinase B/oxoprolinase/acetone carboxylase alpha subunit